MRQPEPKRREVSCFHRALDCYARDLIKFRGEVVPSRKLAGLHRDTAVQRRKGVDEDIVVVVQLNDLHVGHRPKLHLCFSAIRFLAFVPGLSSSVQVGDTKNRQMSGPGGTMIAGNQKEEEEQRTFPSPMGAQSTTYREMVRFWTGLTVAQRDAFERHFWLAQLYDDSHNRFRS